MVEERLDAAEDAGRPVAVLPHAIDEVAAGEVELLFGHGLALVLEEVSGVTSQHLFYLLYGALGNSCHHRLLHI